jgi:hypothetical protein
MNAMVVLTICIACLVIVGCGGSKTTSTSTPAPAQPTTNAQLTTVVAKPGSPLPTSASADGKLVVSGGRLGDLATAAMHTTPGASCSIVYIHPSGKVSTQGGLTPKAAGADGSVSWTWLISPQTVPTGTGTVTVTCGSDKESASITIR